MNPNPTPDVPDYIDDPDTRRIVAERLKAASGNTVVEPILSFDRDLIPPDALAADFDAGVAFASVRLYEALMELKRETDRTVLPESFNGPNFRQRATEQLLFTVASDPKAFRQNASDERGDIVRKLVEYALSVTYQKMLGEADMMEQMGEAL